MNMRRERITSSETSRQYCNESDRTGCGGRNKVSRRNQRRRSQQDSLEPYMRHDPCSNRYMALGRLKTLQDLHLAVTPTIKSTHAGTSFLVRQGREGTCVSLLGRLRLIPNFGFTTSPTLSSTVCSPTSLINATRLGIVAGWASGETRSVIMTRG